MPDRIPLIRVTAMPADTNPYGGVFGGWLMSQMALAAAPSRRGSRGKAVVVAADDLNFTGAMKVGDEIQVYAELTEARADVDAHRGARRSPASATATQESKWRPATSPSSRSTHDDRPRAIAETGREDG